MQIHELNRRPAKITETHVNEMDLRGLLDPTSIGTAKQNAAAISAASSAGELANPGSEMFSTRGIRGIKGYQVGGGAKAKTTPQQQLQIVKTTPAFQQQVKNLAAQWKTVAPGVIATVRKKSAAEPALAEYAINLAPPNTTRDAETKQTLSGLYAQRASGYAPAKYNVPTTGGPEAKPNAETSNAVNADLTIVSNEFKNWANTKLSQVGVKLDAIAADPWTSAQLEQLLLKIATFSLANPSGSDTTNAAVEEFFNVAIASNLAMYKNSDSVAARTTQNRPAAVASGTQDDAALLQKSNIPLNPTQIQTLGKAIQQDLGGSNVIRDTGSELLNALARSAGLRIGK